MVPAVTGVPSPQLMVARKSVTVPSGSASVKVATSTFVSGAPWAPCTATGAAVSAASATTSGPEIVIEAVPGASSVTTTLKGTVPSSRKVCAAAELTVKLPTPGPATTVPGVVVPSPQLITAVKSAAVFVG